MNAESITRDEGAHSTDRVPRAVISRLDAFAGHRSVGPQVRTITRAKNFGPDNDTRRHALKQTGCWCEHDHQIQPAQHRLIDQLAGRVDRVPPADRLFFERRPDRQHRAEIEQVEIAGGKPMTARVIFARTGGSGNRRVTTKFRSERCG
jgi:hypothetical protein